MLLPKSKLGSLPRGSAKENNMQTNSSNPNVPQLASNEVVFDLRQISPSQFAQLGVEHVAYVREILVNGMPAYAIHAADGRPLGIAGGLAAAIAAIREHDMLPTLVH